MTHEPPDDLPDVDRRELDATEEAMHALPYGIYVIGSVEQGDDGEPQPNGMIADWVMQVSFEPRLIAVAFERDSSSLARIRKNDAFTVNLLIAEQDGLELARRFVQPSDGSKVKGRSAEAQAQRHDKLAGVDYSTTEAGCPVLDDALAWLSCEAQQFIDAGDHTLVIGRVLEGDLSGEGEPMTTPYTGWTYSG